MLACAGMALMAKPVAGAVGGMSPLPGDLPSELRPACLDAFTHTLGEWGGASAWERISGPGPGGRAYRSPTKEFGVWVEARFFPEGWTELRRVVPKAVVTTAWRAPDCGPKLSVLERQQPSGFPRVKGASVFDDDDLARLIQSGKPGVIYAWSPGMVYSARLFGDFKKSAKLAGLPVTSVMDPYSPAGNEKRDYVDRTLSTRRMESVELINRGMTIHFPAVLVFAEKRLARVPLFGVKPVEQYARLIQEELRKLTASGGSR